MVLAISTFYKGLADQFRDRIPHAFPPLEVAAAATDIASEMAAPEAPNPAHFKEAIALYLSKLPSDTNLALDVIKMDAAKALGVPGITAEHEAVKAAREALAEAQAAVDAAEAERGRTMSRIHALNQIISDATSNLDGWDFDFDKIEADAEAVISERFGKSGLGAVYDIPHINAAFGELARVGILRRLAPAAIARLKETIATAKAELDQLRTVQASEPEPVKLVRGRQKLTGDTEEGGEPT